MSEVIKSRIFTMTELTSLVSEYVTNFPLTVIDHKQSKILTFQDSESLQKYIESYTTLLLGFIVFAKIDKGYQIICDNFPTITFEQ